MKNYKPFDLEKALAGDKVLYLYDTVEYEVQDVAYLKNVNKVAAFIPKFSATINTFNKNGDREFCKSNSKRNCLVMAPKEVELARYVNVYKDSDGNYTFGDIREVPGKFINYCKYMPVAHGVEVKIKFEE